MLMTTTSEFQTKPDYYTTEKECSEAEKVRINTNPRYKFFFQTHFTAGDIDQFEKYRDATNGSLSLPEEPDEDTVIPEQIAWKKYSNLDPIAVDNTFKYLFYKFKKGIFIKIKDGKLRVFLPFSNKNFVNEWSKRIKIDPKYGDLLSFMKHITTLEGYKFLPQNVNKFIDTWYSNNCLFRYEFPIHEGDTNVPNASDMFKTLCEEREVPDMEFFVNRRDFPLLKTDETEPYSHIYDTSNMPLLSHNYSKYCPILSMVGAKNFADIPIPTGDDWARVCSREDTPKFFLHSDRGSFQTTPVPWKDRKSIAVFRGASTGAGVTIETNQRLKLAYISETQENDDDGQPFLDAGITKWNLRPRKIKGEEYLQTIDIENLPFGLVSFMSPQEQASYKYLINVDGHVASYRLSRELESGTCILLATSKYKLWYRSMLKPYVHYVPVKADLSDLITQIKWCKENDEQCAEIGENARNFAITYLTKDGILNYLQKLLFELKKVNGMYVYNVVTPREVLNRRELKILSGMDNPMKKLSKPTILFKNDNTTITEYNGNIVKKESNDIVHEAFVSLTSTNGLQNFIRIHGFYQSKDSKFILMDSVKGQTLNEYIKCEHFSMNNFLLILVQLSLALRIAQKKCQFVHNDLFPYNIILKTVPEPVTVSYDVDGYTYDVKTMVVPTMIDLQRSHIVLDNHHYGNVNMFSSSTIQDVVTMLVTCIADISSFNLTDDDLQTIITLANFLSHSGYHPKKFAKSGKNGLGDIRFFFVKASKYTEILTSDKCELEEKTPVDLVEYMMKHFRLPVKRKGERDTTEPISKCKYTENTFLQPKKILKLLQDDLECSEMYTLRSIAKTIYSKNLKQLGTTQYTNIYKEIIKA
jgi:hypothetical protein